MDRAKDIKLLIAILAAFFVIFIIAFMVGQSKYLSLRISNLSIEKIELVEYSGKPFESDVVSLKSLDGKSSEAVELIKEMNDANINFFHPQWTSTVIFIYYYNDKLVNAYVSGNNIGLNYGKVWLKIPALEQILNQFN